MQISRNIVIAAVVLVALVGGYFWMQSLPGKYDEFAQCLSSKDVKMYGAFWCKFCNAQKALFGRSWKHVNYVECSTADGSRQTPACISAGIETYPTWEFSGGRRLTGELSLEQLSTETGCELPK